MDILVEVERSGLVESRHHGLAVLVDPTGEVVWSLGDPETVVFPRSANKPFQALGMLAAGLPLDGRLLALASSSHSGEDFHREGVREILALGDLDESLLQTPPSYPIDPKVHADLLRAGGVRSPLLMDCSGKHAAMLLTCRMNDWSTDDYLELDHPLQRQILATFSEFVGAPAVNAVDGCGAPQSSARLVDLARGIGRVMTAEGDAERLRDAMRAHPEYVSGTNRPELPFMRSIPGSVFKSGAEAVFVGGLEDGSAVALKVGDGGERAMYVAMTRVLERAGVDVAGLPATAPVLGGGRPVGEIRPAF